MGLLREFSGNFASVSSRISKKASSGIPTEILSRILFENTFGISRDSFQDFSTDSGSPSGIPSESLLDSFILECLHK